MSAERIARFDRYRGWTLLAAIGFALLMIGSWMTGRDYALAPPLPYLLLLGLFASLVAFLLASTARRGRRVLWHLVTLAPGLLIGFLVVIFVTPTSDEIARVPLPDGRVAHLSTDPLVFTDVSYSLWISSPGLLVWRRPRQTNLSYSEDGGYIGDEKLAVSANGKRLLVGRGGVWTDCLEIADDFAPCELGVEQPWWSEPDYHAKMRAYSEALNRALR